MEEIFPQILTRQHEQQKHILSPILLALLTPSRGPRQQRRKATWGPLISLLQARHPSNRTLKLTALRFIGCQALCQSITSSSCVVLTALLRNTCYYRRHLFFFFFPFLTDEIEAQRINACRRSNRYTEIKLGLESTFCPTPERAHFSP